VALYFTRLNNYISVSLRLLENVSGLLVCVICLYFNASWMPTLIDRYTGQYIVIHAFFCNTFVLWNNKAVVHCCDLWHAGFHPLRGPRPQDVGHLCYGYCFDSKVGPGPPPYRRCLTTYLGSSATQAMCASWQASTIADMPDMLI
jgi:hypothetical protein